MANIDVIWNFLASKGLPPAAIAGIIGNLQVESGLNPTSVNSGEGAHGIANWEGGRWPALESYAASHGGSATDLNTQLGFLWSELSGPYAGVLQQLRSASDPSQAAAVFDQNYEVSSGAARGQRQANAANILSAFQKSGVGGLASVVPTTSAASGSGTFDASSGATAATAPTQSQFDSVLGDWSQLVNQIPELKKLLTDYTDGTISGTEGLLTAFHKTNWWRDNSTQAKQLILNKIVNPADYKQQMSQAITSVMNVAHQRGVTLSTAQATALGQQYIIEGWDAQTLQNKVGQDWKAGGTPMGDAAAVQHDLKALYDSYGVPMSAAALNLRTQQIMTGAQTMDTYKANAVASAKSMFPSLAAQLDSGLTVHDIADPYKQQMANLLEIDPANIETNDPLIRKALQGSVVNTGGKAVATSTPLWQFENTLRADPRWANTQNAKDTVSTALTKVGQDWGFNA